MSLPVRWPPGTRPRRASDVRREPRRERSPRWHPALALPLVPQFVQIARWIGERAGEFIDDVVAAPQLDATLPNRPRDQYGARLEPGLTQLFDRDGHLVLTGYLCHPLLILLDVKDALGGADMPPQGASAPESPPPPPSPSSSSRRCPRSRRPRISPGGGRRTRSPPRGARLPAARPSGRGRVLRSSP